MSIRMRGEGWYLRTKVGAPKGKQAELFLGIYGIEHRKEAEKVAAKIVAKRRKIAAQTKALTTAVDSHVEQLRRAGVDTDIREVLTFGAWTDLYLKTYTPTKAKRQHSRDDAILSFWKTIPFSPGRTWADVKLAEFKESHCLAALAYRRKQGTRNPLWKQQREHVAESTVQRERGLVQAVFERAIDNDELRSRNPWSTVPKEPSEARNRLLTEEDYQKVQAAFIGLPGAPGEESVGARWSRWLTLLWETGLRLDESLKIEARDLTYAPGYLHIHGKGRKRLSKCTTCGRVGGKCRDIILTPVARKALADQWAAESRYFTQHESRYRHVLEKAAKRAGLLNSDTFPYAFLSPHDIRHSFGARYIQRGGKIYTLSKILGHSSVAVTEKHYAFMSRDDVATEMLAVMSAKPVLSLVAGSH